MFAVIAGLLIAWGSLFFFSGFPPSFSPRRYVCCRAEAPLSIDGKLDEEAWKKAEWTADFNDIEGSKKPRPEYRTRAKMLWDSTFFYIAAELEEPHVWATLKKRDSVIFHDNDFEVFIDPDGDTHRYYELEMNAFNTVWDLFLDRPYRDGGAALFFWDIRGLKTAVFVNGTINDPEDKDKGWSVEIAIPWAVLKECAPKAPPSPGDQWRVNFSRVEWQVKIEEGLYTKIKNPKIGKPLPESNWVWSPQGLINMHYPELWGYVQFSEKAAGKGEEPFRWNREEDAKWALRQVYYGEWAYHKKHDTFTDSPSKLNVPACTVEGYKWPPSILHTWNSFEARLESVDGRGCWHISHLGRVWKIPEKD